MDYLFLDHLQLNHFKNYTNEQFTFVRGVNIITGKNGMGKTNVLDAVYYQSVFKSYFARKDGDLIEKGADYFRIEGKWEVGNRPLKVAQAYRNGQKHFFLNDQKETKKSEFIGQLPVVMICPEDQLIIREGSRIRRKIFDHILSLNDQDYLRALMQYNRLLRQRNQYLKQTAKHQINYDVVLTYTRQMDPLAQFIYENRASLTKSFRLNFPNDYQNLSASTESCDIQYQSTLQHNTLEEVHKKSLDKDVILGRTNTGIHRDDWLFSINGDRVKYFGSQGQQKTFIIAVKIGLCRELMKMKKIVPLLLLDDIFDKLDPKRMELLLDWIINKSDFQQVLITDTDPQRLQELLLKKDQQIKNFIVTEGKISHEEKTQ